MRAVRVRGAKLSSTFSQAFSLPTDLYWDTIVRFYHMDVPRQVFVDMLDIARDEVKHFMWLDSRLRELGSFYGALPAHKALWEQGNSTRESLRARLALIPLVQEAKALEAAPRLTEKLRSLPDVASAQLVQQICSEEVGHVYKGLQWFVHMCQQQDIDPVHTFHREVRTHCRAPLQAPFNEAARAMASMWPEWFLPVSTAEHTGKTWAVQRLR
jgi:uncharacterized ferritin-like protein (DUF455 family)